MLYMTRKSVPDSVAAKFRNSLTKHIFYVQKANELVKLGYGAVVKTHFFKNETVEPV